MLQYQIAISTCVVYRQDIFKQEIKSQKSKNLYTMTTELRKALSAGSFHTLLLLQDLD